MQKVFVKVRYAAILLTDECRFVLEHLACERQGGRKNERRLFGCGKFRGCLS